MRFQTLNDILPINAREDRHVTLVQGEDQQQTLSFRTLRHRALSLLGVLQRRLLRPGDAMILCLADNAQFVEMFWACVMGGVVPVPLAPGTSDEHRRKLLRVFGRFDKVTVYIDSPSLARLDSFASAHGLGEEAASLRASAILSGSVHSGITLGDPVECRADDLAMIQFSSGSTGEPKGVMLTHRNLCANIASITEAAEFTDGDRALSWMPLSHDMGLIGFHLNMLACGASHTIMRTELFVRRPLLWLELATQQSATVLCSPNFGYQHYLRQFASKRPAALDLSSVRLIFNGAEPISADLCRRFTDALSAYGLKPNTMFAVYGLAEASLAVSFPVPGAPLKTVWLDRAALQSGTAMEVLSDSSHKGAEFVRLGAPVPGCELRIADLNGKKLFDHLLGHVQIRGENVTGGYYRDTEASASTRTSDGWLDTGDLGLFIDGELIVAGRAKELIIVNGQNYYPSDVERIAELVPGIEVNRVAAASVYGSSEEVEVAALFVVYRDDLKKFLPRAAMLRQLVAQATGLDVAYVVPVKQIPKTTSGKLQRNLCAEAFNRGEYQTILAELAALTASEALFDASKPTSLSTVERLVAICGPLVTTQTITFDTNLLEISLNSLSLARIHEAIEREFPEKVEVTDFFDYPTLGQLAGFIDASRA